MLQKIVPATTLTLVASETILVTAAYVVPVYLLVDIDPYVWLIYENGIARLSVMIIGILMAMYLQDKYSEFRVLNRFKLIQEVAAAMGAAFLLQAFVGYALPDLVIPRRVILAGSLALMVILPLWRVLFSSALVSGLSAERVLFLGANPVARQIAESLSGRPELGFSVLGFLEEPAAVNGATPHLGRIEDLRRVVGQTNPDRVVVGLTERRERLPFSELLDVKFSGVLVDDAATMYELVFQRVCVAQLRHSQLIFSAELGPRRFVQNLQTFYSAAGALTGLILAGPIMLLVAVLVRLTSPGPALYRQRRVGRNGKVFTLFKFRSMRQDAEAKTGAVWAQQNDPRITRFGRFLRRSRLDELPQLINVVKGEMSLVGPRPERPEFVETLTEQIPFYRQRHCVKPGITGWAQINHKYGDTLEDTITKLEYDLYYIKNLSPALDFYTMFQTGKVMLLSRGAQ